MEDDGKINPQQTKKKVLAAAGEVMNRFYTYSTKERQNILDNIVRMKKKDER
ncbi:hypothetical protein SDC9_189226 [bioreactor metagenome]|uniref:Uncharacterized protein n=1 Tax=bioreactor metagenome TaxID=1076179 RepID=A0A645HT77_9ZZZZ